MTEYVSTTPGLYPLPDPAKETLADLKGHQKHDLISGSEEERIVEVYDEARKTVVDDQRAAGLDRVVEGNLRWDDMLAHPLIVADEVDPGGIVRYYDNNNFYRDPGVTATPTATGDVATELSAARELLDGEALQATLPGPYSLASLASNGYADDDAAFLHDIAGLLADEAEQFPAHETLFLLEPSLAADPPGEELDAEVPTAIDAVVDAVPDDVDVVVHTYWGSIPEKPYAHLLDADLDAVGVDLVAGDRESILYAINEYGTTDAVALGVADGQNTRVETAGTLAERVEWFEESVPAQSFDRVYATANTGLFHLPTSKYREKLSSLADAAAIARGDREPAEEVTA